MNLKFQKTRQKFKDELARRSLLAEIKATGLADVDFYTLRTRSPNAFDYWPIARNASGENVGAILVKFRSVPDRSGWIAEILKDNEKIISVLDVARKLDNDHLRRFNELLKQEPGVKKQEVEPGLKKTKLVKLVECFEITAISMTITSAADYLLNSSREIGEFALSTFFFAVIPIIVIRKSLSNLQKECSDKEEYDPLDMKIRKTMMTMIQASMLVVGTTACIAFFWTADILNPYTAAIIFGMSAFAGKLRLSLEQRKIRSADQPKKQEDIQSKARTPELLDPMQNELKETVQMHEEKAQNHHEFVRKLIEPPLWFGKMFFGVGAIYGFLSGQVATACIGVVVAVLCHVGLQKLKKEENVTNNEGDKDSKDNDSKDQ